MVKNAKLSRQKVCTRNGLHGVKMTNQFVNVFCLAAKGKKTIDCFCFKMGILHGALDTAFPLPTTYNFAVKVFSCACHFRFYYKPLAKTLWLFLGTEKPTGTKLLIKLRVPTMRLMGLLFLVFNLRDLHVPASNGRAALASKALYSCCIFKQLNINDVIN